MAILAGRHHLGTDRGRIVLTTARDGLAAQAGHDLTIEAARWSGELVVGDDLTPASLEVQVDLGRSRLESMLKVLDVDGAVRRVSRGWEATGQSWVYDTERYERVAAERTREQQAMLGYVATTSCRMDYLRRELDDPAAAPCGRCDNCTGTFRPAKVSRASADTARARLQRPGVTLPPRRMWPTGMAELGVAATGRISAAETAAPGRSVGRLTDIGWGVTLGRLLAESAPDEAVPEGLFAAVVQVLAAWEWDQRPVAVVTVPSRTRPSMITALGERIAATGKMTYLGSLGYLGDESPRRQHNSTRSPSIRHGKSRSPVSKSFTCTPIESISPSASFAFCTCASASVRLRATPAMSTVIPPERKIR